MKNKAFLDILFENRNKEYGAYQLRQIADYDLMKSLFVGIGIVALITGGTIYANNRTINAETITGEHKVIVDVIDVTPPVEKKKEIVVNPNKIIRTCSCCFREIALSKSGHMVHHGFQRPGDGYQTDSCFGISYKPLERSNEGLVAIIDVIEKQLEHKNSAYKKLETSKEVSFVNPNEK